MEIDTPSLVLSQTNSLIDSVDFEELLAEFNYKFFGPDLKLIDINTGSGFVFQGQDHYDNLCQFVTKYIQQQLVRQYKMSEIFIPEDEDGPKGNIFISSNFYDARVKKCLVIIQGTGEVRAGQFLNHSIAVIAHSAGGRCVADLYSRFKDEFINKVKALVFTDSFYHGMCLSMNPKEIEWARKVGIHYKKYNRQYKQLGEQFKQQQGHILEVSAGTDRHELTTGFSHSLIVQFIDQKFKIGSNQKI
ncbi:UNKNOWN [Stylonychia lemnae]|uniref:Uncharacterized protein n=1 Tax=Stylonychia lemnae TaxID=5949 RepID=A0A078A8T7_STYLE|nr:UNKNOWN [Stylonychia lemnae]|eukprot:CDW78685.1 UNKNOWN [Stylonychia lemnae]